MSRARSCRAGAASVPAKQGPSHSYHRSPRRLGFPGWTSFSFFFSSLCRCLMLYSEASRGAGRREALTPFITEARSAEGSGLSETLI